MDAGEIARERLERVALAKLDEVGEAGGHQVGARVRDLRRLELAADERAAAVVTERRREVERREPERRPELDDGPRARRAREHVAQLARLGRDGHVDVLDPVVELAVVGVGVGHARAALFGRERAEHLAQDGGARVGLGVEPREELGDGRGGQRCSWWILSASGWRVPATRGKIRINIRVHNSRSRGSPCRSPRPPDLAEKTARAGALDGARRRHPRGRDSRSRARGREPLHDHPRRGGSGRQYRLALSILPQQAGAPLPAPARTSGRRRGRRSTRSWATPLARPRSACATPCGPSSARSATKPRCASPSTPPRPLTATTRSRAPGVGAAVGSSAPSSPPRRRARPRASGPSPASSSS